MVSQYCDVQCDVQVVENTFVFDSKQMIQMINRYKQFQTDFDMTWKIGPH